MYVVVHDVMRSPVESVEVQTCVISITFSCCGGVGRARVCNRMSRVETHIPAGSDQKHNATLPKCSFPFL